VLIPDSHLVGPPDPERRYRLLEQVRRTGREAPSTHNQALAALTFLYVQVLRAPFDRVPGIMPAPRQRGVPTVLSLREIGLLLEQLEGVPHLAVLLMYGGGLRVLECPTLRIKDVDMDRREIVVRGGKGGKDRRATGNGSITAT
jgi:integrase